ncbi:glycosyltransferase [Vibrio cholerae]|nr:glycosyltransferase [Vibrio cholerae]
MKVLIYCENYRKGGLDTFLANLIKYWPEDEVSLMINKTHEGIDFLKSHINPDNVIELGLFSRHNFFKEAGKYNNFRVPLLFLNVFLLVLSYLVQPFQLIGLFLKYRSYDRLLIVNGGYPGGQSCNIAAIVWFLIKGEKSWYNFHNNARKYNRLLKPLQIAFDFLVSKTTIEFISVSKDCTNSMHCRAGIEHDKLSFIYNGIETPSITSDLRSLCSIRREVLDSNRKRIVMLGTYELRKGHEFAFSVMKQLPQYDLIVCGKGTESETERILSMSQEINNIYLLGHRTDNYNIIATSDLLLVPSMCNESFGLTIIEAMALNVPVIATRTGGMQEVITEQWDGLLVDYGDVFQLKESIIRLMEDVELREKIKTNAVNSFKNKYGANIMALAYKNKLDVQRVK